ncbi:DHH family phosphoesterase [Clostridium cellulovorans]|uniref:Cyclic-di-AMP phosphodiesterase n=1 Tax=Clostridium cellulovorans (strain ATCC 35296 / DSM 3052 / OCM 3 / 743B) TaxID=573061 RepID=D9SPB7_CLOC7|nr:DHH family phosphoesterase [Clostridium cellulovorans]ADL54019.1 putative PAS/PAC sensor protein [Clostridium cellulovorans 743B]
MEKKFNFLKPRNEYFFVIIIIAIATMFILKHYVIASVFLIAFVGLLIYTKRVNKSKQSQWKEFVDGFINSVDNASKGILVRMPFPVAIIDTNGIILWYNQVFMDRFPENAILSSDIDSLLSSDDIQNILDSKTNIFKDISIKKESYDIYTSQIETKSEIDRDVLVLYFIDSSEKAEIKKALKDNAEVVMLIDADNLDEVRKSTTEDKRPLLEAEIKRAINSYSQRLNAVYKQYSTGKYILITHRNELQKEIEKKFEILNQIREIDTGNTLDVTLSIGVGFGDNTPMKNHENAFSALELALGRGGDQVVLKSSDALEFFGGSTKEVEKRSRVKTRVFAHALKDVINNSTNVFLMGHSNPDIDCIGAAIGLSSVIRALGKRSHIIIDSFNNSIEEIADRYMKEQIDEKTFVSGSDVDNLITDESLIIIVDTNSKNYVLNYEVFKRFKKSVIIDHHRRARVGVETPLLMYVETYASSTSEIVTELIQYMKENHKITNTEAEALLAGIVVDTKNFCFKTGVRTFEAAAYLRSQGADTVYLKKLFSNDLKRYIDKSDIIRQAEVENGIAIAVSPLDVEDNILAAQTADELLNITGVIASFVLIKVGNDVLVSGRSLGDLNVQLISEALGGGGHFTMAGARLKDKSLEEATKELKEAIAKIQREGEE